MAYMNFCADQYQMTVSRTKKINETIRPLFVHRDDKKMAQLSTKNQPNMVYN
jgi:hypothetical protein